MDSVLDRKGLQRGIYQLRLVNLTRKHGMMVIFWLRNCSKGVKYIVPIFMAKICCYGCNNLALILVRSFCTFAASLSQSARTQPCKFSKAMVVMACIQASFSLSAGM